MLYIVFFEFIHMEIKVCAHERFHFQFQFWNKICSLTVFVCCFLHSTFTEKNDDDDNDAHDQHNTSIVRLKFFIWLWVVDRVLFFALFVLYTICVLACLKGEAIQWKRKRETEKRCDPTPK